MNLFLQKIQANGFHLIEILIVISIISILSAVGIPTYTQYVTQAKRAEAASTLAQLAIAMEQFYLEHDSYQSVTLATLHFPEEIADHQYQLRIQLENTHSYVLHAKPMGKQEERDSACGTLSLDSLNQKRVTGSGSVEECW